MKVMLIAGARPNFMKVASIIDAINAHNRSSVLPVHYLLVHTGQHYDERMSEVFFKDLELPQPDIDLGVGSSS
jgi:UDP-N-acetylglucosamine 2-epimerase (non-hydrolysing)